MAAMTGAGDDVEGGGGAGDPPHAAPTTNASRSEEHTSELQSQSNLVCRLLLEKKKQIHRLAVNGRSPASCFQTPTPPVPPPNALIRTLTQQHTPRPAAVPTPVPSPWVDCYYS